MLEAALAYHEAGLAVIPLAPRGKQPLIRGWQRFADTRPSRDQLEKWFARWPDANIGAVTGQSSGMVVLDIDNRAGGAEAMEELALELPSTVITITGDGYHYWFTSEDRLRSQDVAPGVQLLGHPHVVVLPGSIHPSGHTYRFQGPSFSEATPAPLPVALRELLKRPSAPADATPLAPVYRLDGEPHPYALRMLERGAAEVASARETTRNNTLWWQSYRAFGFVAGGTLGASAAKEQMIRAGLASGMSRREVRGTVASALRSGQKRPLLPPSLRQQNAVGERIQSIRAAVATIDWRGRRGDRDKRVLDFLLDLTERRGRWQLRLAARYVALKVGVSPATAWRALQSLEELGFLRTISTGRRGGAGIEAASVYVLVPPAPCSGNIVSFPSARPSRRHPTPGRDGDRQDRCATVTELGA